MVREQAIERARAARVLLSGQQLAEGVRLAREALELALSVLGDDARAEAHELIATRSPRRDREISRSDVLRAEQALSLIDGLEDVERTRGQRRALTSLAVLAGVGVLAYVLTPGPAIVASASATYDAVPDHAAASVLDARQDTQWLLPDRSEGWLELRFRAPRAVSGVEIQNGTNAPFHDRAAERIEVTLFGASGAILARAERTLAFGENVQVDIAAADVARLRITVLSWHRVGGALGHVRVLP